MYEAHRLDWGKIMSWCLRFEIRCFRESSSRQDKVQLCRVYWSPVRHAKKKLFLTKLSRGLNTWSLVVLCTTYFHVKDCRFLKFLVPLVAFTRKLTLVVPVSQVCSLADRIRCSNCTDNSDFIGLWWSKLHQSMAAKYEGSQVSIALYKLAALFIFVRNEKQID